MTSPSARHVCLIGGVLDPSTEDYRERRFCSAPLSAVDAAVALFPACRG